MPLPLFHNRNPRPEDSPSSFSSFSAVQSHVRSILNGGSVYADSPAPSNRSTPKLPSLSLFRRGNRTPSSSSSDEYLPRGSSESSSPLQTERHAASYERAVAPLSPDETPVLPPAAYRRESSIYESVDPETAQLAVLVNQRSRRRQRGSWRRRRSDRETCFENTRTTPVRRKAVLCLLSGIFLGVVLTIYLSIALTRPNIGQEVHVLFILVILSTTILFCHSLVRLCMLSLHPPASDEQPRIPSMTGPEGFQPIIPIRVHLALDEEIAEVERQRMDAEKEVIKAPPPAYGLWRCSVPINPNLLHWQRVDGCPTPLSHPSSPNIISADPFLTPNPQQQDLGPNDAREGPRPPSYMSDDGVRYVVEAAPRSVAPAPSDPYAWPERCASRSPGSLMTRGADAEI